MHAKWVKILCKKKLNDNQLAWLRRNKLTIFLFLIDIHLIIKTNIKYPRIWKERTSIKQKRGKQKLHQEVRKNVPQLRKCLMFSLIANLIFFGVWQMNYYLKVGNLFQSWGEESSQNFKSTSYIRKTTRHTVTVRNANWCVNNEALKLLST